MLRPRLALKPDFAEAHCNRANSLARLGRHEEALAGYDRALALNPRQLDALNNRGAVLKALARYEEALASLEAALQIKPDFADAHSNLGNVAASAQPPGGGRSDPTRQPSRCGRTMRRPTTISAMRCRLLNRYEEAIAQYHTAISLKPDYAEAHSGLGVVLQALDRDDEAASHYDQAIGLKAGLRRGKMEQEPAAPGPRIALRKAGRFTRTGGRSTGQLRYAERRWNGEPVNGTLSDLGRAGSRRRNPVFVDGPGARRVGAVGRARSRASPGDLFSRSFPGVNVIGQSRRALRRARSMRRSRSAVSANILRTGWQAFPVREQGYLVADGERAAGLRQRLARGRNCRGTVLEQPESEIRQGQVSGH